MQRSFLQLVLALSAVAALGTRSLAQNNVAINPSGAAPNAKTLLDISATDRGILIPRMTYAQRLAIAGLGAADAGLWVYQLDDSLAGSTRGSHGYWFYNYDPVTPANSRWTRWSAASHGWRLAGNNNTSSATHFLGTVAGSNDDLHIRTTSTGANPQILISATNGNVAVNPVAAGVERLDINGGLKVGNTALNTAGAIKFDAAAVTPNRWHYGNVDGTATGWKRLENAEKRYSPEDYSPAVNQCLGVAGQIIKGTVNNAITPGGNVVTPFPTNTGSNNRRGFRTQYIFPASELLAAGLCAGPITKFSFYVLQNDGLGCSPSLFNCPDLKIDIRMGHTALSNFGPYVATSATPLSVDWDPAVEASAQLNTQAANPLLVSSGWMDFTLSGGGFNWNGVSNMIIDVSWLRATTNGNSPAVQNEPALAYTASKWMQITSGSDITHGNSFQDNDGSNQMTTGNPGLPVVQPGAVQGTTFYRPVTRFFGNVQSPGNGPQTAGAFINYGGGLIIDSTANPVTWADVNYRGPGTVRARVAVYDGSLALSDHVFDKYYDGQVQPADEQASQGYAYVGVRELKDYLEANRHLPNMPSRDQWEANGGSSVGQLQTGLWESVETQALRISELEKDLSSLEALAFGKPKTQQELDALLTEVNTSRRLTDQQKLHLADAIRQRFAQLQETK